jgi:hypothetical protein
MQQRLVIYADKAAAESRITQIERDLGFPRESISHGTGIQPKPGECRAERYAELVESVDGKNFGIPIDQYGEATLSRTVKDRIAEVNLDTWGKLSAVAEEPIAEELIK